MDERDLMWRELLHLCTRYQKAIRKGICIASKGQTSLEQLQQTRKLQLGPGQVIVENVTILDG